VGDRVAQRRKLVFYAWPRLHAYSSAKEETAVYRYEGIFSIFFFMLGVASPSTFLASYFLFCVTENTLES
jgi:hypothetical protein